MYFPVENSNERNHRQCKCACRCGGMMSERVLDRQGSPSMLARTEEIQREIQQLSGRDLQLWSIGILITLVLTAGLLALLLPNLMWAQRVVLVEHSYLPQL